MDIVFEGISFKEPDYDNDRFYRNKTVDAVHKGILHKKPCEICGKIDVQAHHEIYSDYLNVRWLCKSHHHKIHRIFRRNSKDFINMRSSLV